MPGRFAVAIVFAIGVGFVVGACTSGSSAGGTDDARAPRVPARPLGDGDADADAVRKAADQIPAYVPPAEGLPSAAHAEGRGFLLRTGSDDDFARAWAGRVDIALHSLRNRYPPRARDALRPLEVCLFADRAAYDRHTDAHAPENSEAAGYFDPVPRRVVTIDPGTDRALQATLIHELTHVALRDHLGSVYLPPWIDEGLASYHETARVRGGRLEYVDRHPKFGLLAYNRTVVGLRLTFKALATTGLVGFTLANAAAREDCYAQAWAWIAFLRGDGAGAYGYLLDRYLDAITAATRTRHTDSTLRYIPLFDTVFAPHAEEMERAFDAFVLRELGD